MGGRAIIVAACLAISAGGAHACVAGAKCQTVPEHMKSDTWEVGETLPRGKYQMLVNAPFYGLPRPETGTLYFRVERRVLRVRFDTFEVVEDVTHLVNRSF